MSFDPTARQLAQDAWSASSQAMMLAQAAQAVTVSLSFQAYVAIPAGALVNLFSSGAGTMMRLADASLGLPAHGFAPTAVVAGEAGAFLRGGVDVGAGYEEFIADLWLSDTTPGTSTSVQPTTAGHILQRVGMATETGMIVDLGPSILLAGQ